MPSEPAAPPAPKLAEIWDLVALSEAGGAESLSERARCELEFRKWQVIHAYIHAHPFPTRTQLARSEQWREALGLLRSLRDGELIDWLILQAEVARNIERGVRDIRPRKNGPCHAVVLEYVANRKRKALAILHFAIKAEEEGCYRVDGEWHKRTSEILRRYNLIERDENGNPVYSMDPFARS